jgi:hypothetical protein
MDKQPVLNLICAAPQTEALPAHALSGQLNTAALRRVAAQLSEAQAESLVQSALTGLFVRYCRERR